MAGAKTFPIIDAKGDLITTVTGWNHGTVADGCELTKMTIEPICSALNISMGEVKDFNDDLSALSAKVDKFIYDEYAEFHDRVEQSATYLYNSISAESARAVSAEQGLQQQIDVIKGATDVIAVFGTYDEFTTKSASEFIVCTKDCNNISSTFYNIYLLL